MIAQESTPKRPNHIDPRLHDCIENCTNAHRICEQLISHCLSMGGVHSDPGHIRMLRDCAQMCALSVDFMLRESDLHPKTCGLCAEICERCAEDCEAIAGNDEMMNLCAETCRLCAKTCRQMSEMQ